MGGIPNLMLQIILICLVLIAAWYVAERFSPDPLITTLVKIAIFAIAIYVVFVKILPIIGVA